MIKSQPNINHDITIIVAGKTRIGTSTVQQIIAKALLEAGLEVELQGCDPSGVGLVRAPDQQKRIEKIKESNTSILVREDKLSKHGDRIIFFNEELYND